MRIDWKDKRDIPGDIMTVEQFAKIVKYFRHIHFCGQISDPIFNPNFTFNVCAVLCSISKYIN